MMLYFLSRSFCKDASKRYSPAYSKDFISKITQLIAEIKAEKDPALKIKKHIELECLYKGESMGESINLKRSLLRAMADKTKK